MHPPKQLHGSASTLRTNADIEVPHTLKQFRHSHAGIEAAKPLASLKFKDEPEVTRFHAVIKKTIVADLLKTCRKHMRQIAPDEFHVVQRDLTFRAAWL